MQVNLKDFNTVTSVEEDSIEGGFDKLNGGKDQENLGERKGNGG